MCQTRRNCGGWRARWPPTRLTHSSVYTVRELKAASYVWYWEQQPLGTVWSRGWGGGEAGREWWGALATRASRCSRDSTPDTPERSAGLIERQVTQSGSEKRFAARKFCKTRQVE